MDYSAKLKQYIQKESTQRELYTRQVKDYQKNLDSTLRGIETAKKARLLIQRVAKETQDKLQYHITNVVSNAMAAIWEDPYKLDLEFVSKRGQTEANISYSRGGYNYSPMSCGGGALDIGSFALRLAFWGLSSSAQVVLLDEPSKHLSADKQDRYCELLKELQSTLNIQFIIVSHIEKLKQSADTLIEVSEGTII